MAVQGTPHFGDPLNVRPRPNCGRDWGTGLACQFCRQVEGLPLGVHDVLERLFTTGPWIPNTLTPA